MNSISFESPESYLFGHYLKKKHSTAFNICQDVLKSGSLLHKRGIDDSESHTTVIAHYKSISGLIRHDEACGSDSQDLYNFK